MENTTNFDELEVMFTLKAKQAMIISDLLKKNMDALPYGFVHNNELFGVPGTLDMFIHRAIEAFKKQQQVSQ